MRRAARKSGNGCIGERGRVQRKVSQVDAADRLVTWPDTKKLAELLLPQIRFDGAENIAAVPRYKPNDSGAPAVCHLVNKNYQPATESMMKQEDFRVVFAGSLYGRVFSKATLYAPGQDPMDIDTRDLGDATELTVPQLNLWAILRLE